MSLSQPKSYNRNLDRQNKMRINKIIRHLLTPTNISINRLEVYYY